MRIARERWWLLLMFAGWILLGLWLISCLSSRDSLMHGDPVFELEDPKQCVSHFLLMFAQVEEGRKSGGNVSETAISASGEESGKYAGTRVTNSEMRWISMICYLDDEQAKRFVYECAESMLPCPIQKVMTDCEPKETP